MRGPRLVDEDVRAERSVDEAHGDAGVRRVRQRSLPLDPQELAASLGALDHEPLGCAGQEVGNDRVDRGSPSPRSRSRSGRSERTPTSGHMGGEVELDGDRLLPDRAVGSDGEDDLGRNLEVLASRDAELGRRLPEVTELDALLSGEAAQLGIVAELVQPALEVEPGADRVLQELAPRRREAAALVATPTVAVVGPYTSASSTVATIGISR